MFTPSAVAFTLSFYVMPFLYLTCSRALCLFYCSLTVCLLRCFAAWNQRTSRLLHRSVSMPAQVTACCWDPNSPGVVGLCSADGSFLVVQHELGNSLHESPPSFHCCSLLRPCPNRIVIVNRKSKLITCSFRECLEQREMQPKNNGQLQPTNSIRTVQNYVHMPTI